jgi:hypothetical protein
MSRSDVLRSYPAFLVGDFGGLMSALPPIADMLSVGINVR